MIIAAYVDRLALGCIQFIDDPGFILRQLCRDRLEYRP